MRVLLAQHQKNGTMIPPRCHVCGLQLRDVPDDGRKHFTLVYFGATEDEKMHDSRVMARYGREGHPRNAIWFCNEHVSVARQHEDMEVRAALEAIDAATGRKPQRRHGQAGAAGSKA